MDRLSPLPAAEPGIPDASGSSALRRTAYGLLALMLAAGAWVRFNDQIAAVSPVVAAPAASAAAAVAGSGAARALVELAMLPADAAPGAVATMALPRGEAAALVADLKRDRVRLVQLPVFDVGAAPDAGEAAGHAVQTGHAVEISSGGYTRLLRLTRRPVVVTLPIDRAGTVSFRPVGLGPSEHVGIGALTVAGPVPLPELAAGQALDVGVIAQ